MKLFGKRSTRETCCPSCGSSCARDEKLRREAAAILSGGIRLV